MTDNTMSEESDQAGLPGAPTPPATEAAFRIALDFIAVAADPREARKRLKGYYGALTAADAAQKNLLAAASEFEAFRSTAADALAARERAVRGREVKVSVAEENLRDRERGLIEQASELRRQDMILRRRVMTLARIEAPGPLQEFPGWKQISADLLNVELDLVDEAEVAIERVEHAPADSTLRRATYHPRRSTRRVSAEA
jgi:hypothetical protein